jgi:Reverse transcriptase (RNA-dependent DNA polymerase)
MKSVFTQGALTDDIYIYQPEGFKDPKYSKKVLKLNKALYSLKQAAQIWSKTLSIEL